MRVGFVAKRIAGTDGVSLEVGKWAEVLERMGHSCFYIAGECDRPEDQVQLIPEAHFNHRTVERSTGHVSAGKSAASRCPPPSTR